MCPLDPRGEIGDAHGPWLCKLELEASNLTLENHPRREKTGLAVTCTSHQVSLMCLS